MAELVIIPRTKGPDPAYQDGDLVCAFRDARIECVHAQHICFPRDDAGTRPVTSDGLRVDLTGDRLDQRFLELTSRYKFERVSSAEVRKTWLLPDDRFGLPAGHTMLVTSTPNALGEAMDVPRFVRGRLDAAKSLNNGRALFGSPGREVWYGGTRMVDSDIDAIWSMIEARSPFRRVDHRRWPLTPIERRKFLVLPVDDFDAPESERLVEPVLDADGEIVRKRRRFTAWRDVVPSRHRDSVTDTTKELDLRDELAPLARAAIVQEKS